MRFFPPLKNPPLRRVSAGLYRFSGNFTDIKEERYMATVCGFFTGVRIAFGFMLGVEMC